MGVKRGWMGLVVVCISLVSSVCQAKSVFAVASHGNSKVKAYLIDPTQCDHLSGNN